MSAKTKVTHARAEAVQGAVSRLRKFEVRESPRPLNIPTHITLVSDGNHTVAGFVMGAGFTLEVAQEMARRCNAHEDLLAALVMCESALRNYNFTEGNSRAAEDRKNGIDAARAAIAKARGGK